MPDVPPGEVDLDRIRRRTEGMREAEHVVRRRRRTFARDPYPLLKLVAVSSGVSGRRGRRQVALAGSCGGAELMSFTVVRRRRSNRCRSRAKAPPRRRRRSGRSACRRSDDLRRALASRGERRRVGEPCAGHRLTDNRTTMFLLTRLAMIASVSDRLEVPPREAELGRRRSRGWRNDAGRRQCSCAQERPVDVADGDEEPSGAGTTSR